MNRERDSGGSNLKSLVVGCWEKWGFILALMLSLDLCCGLLTVPRACSVCLSVSHLAVCLSLVLFHSMAPRVLAYDGVHEPWGRGASFDFCPSAELDPLGPHGRLAAEPGARPG